MTAILHISSSSDLQSSVTREVGAAALTSLKKTFPGAIVIERDLVKNPVPHVGPDFVASRYTSPDAASLALSRELIGEIMTSDVLLIEAPMYNFNIPSVLKAWIDHIVRSGLTFKYGATGPEGLVKGKKAVLVIGRGAVYRDAPMKALDYQETYLRTILAFIGITDVETIAIEGVGLGAEVRSKAVAAGKARAASIGAKAA